MAAGAREVRAGKAYVEVALKDKTAAGLARLSKRLTAAGQAMQNVGKGMMKWGAGITAPLLLAAKYAADSGSALYDMSKRTGMSVEKLSALAYAAKQTGTSLEDVEGAIKRMQKGFASGGRAPAAMFDEAVKSILSFKDPADRANRAMELFGKSGTMLLPMIEELAELEARAKRLGLIVTTDTAKRMDDFGDAIEDAKLTVQRLWFEIGAALAPVLKRTAEWLTAAAISAKGWIVQNKGLAVTILSVGAALTVGGAALYAFGIAAKITAIAVSGLALAIKFAYLMASFFPAISLAAAIGLIAAIAINSTGALKGLGKAFGEIGDTARIAFGAIGDALATGDIILAAQIFWVSLKTAFMQGVAAILELWDAGTSRLGEWWFDTLKGIRAAWEIITNSIGSVWIDTIAFLKSAWVSFSAWYENLIADLGDSAVLMLITAKEKAGKLTKDEADFQRDYVRKMSATDRGARDHGERENKSAIEDNRAKSQADRERDFAKRMADIGGQRRDKSLPSGAAAGANASVEQLKAQRDALVRDANNARLSKMVDDEIAAVFADTGSGSAFDLSARTDQAKARGTFNSAALAGLAVSGDDARRTAKATEKSSKLLGDLYDVVVLKGGVFA